MRKFTMPPHEYSETWLPDSIAHGLDYMLREDGGWEFYYNYLDYLWHIDGTELRARHYLGRSEPARVSVDLCFAEFDQPKFTGVLAYLQRRYEVITTFENDRYTVGWIAAGLAGRTQVDVFYEDVWRILREDWDPLSVRHAAGEIETYNSYGKLIAAMLVSGRPASYVAEYLLEMEVQQMALSGDPARARLVAEKLWALANLPPQARS